MIKQDKIYRTIESSREVAATALMFPIQIDPKGDDATIGVGSSFSKFVLNPAYSVIHLIIRLTRINF